MILRPPISTLSSSSAASDVYKRQDQSYIKLELDISDVDGSAGKAKLHVYRAGYKDTDTPTQPLRSIDISPQVINHANKNAEHVFEFRSVFGQIAISIDGNASFTGAAAAAPGGGPRDGPPPGGGRGGAANSVNLNPMGSGGNYLPFGMLCDIGFAVAPGQNAAFRDVTVRNNRVPNNILFQENLTGGTYQGIFARSATPGSGFSVASGSYVLAGGPKGVFLTADPSCYAAPMLRTTFK